jgi:hypothetical protein
MNHLQPGRPSQLASANQRPASWLDGLTGGAADGLSGGASGSMFPVRTSAIWETKRVLILMGSRSRFSGMRDSGSERDGCMMYENFSCSWGSNS